MTFTLDFPGSEPSHYAISVSSDGHSTYDSDGKLSPDSEGDPFHLDFSMSAETSQRIFELAERAHYFQGESRFQKEESGVHRGQDFDLQRRGEEYAQPPTTTRPWLRCSRSRSCSRASPYAGIWPAVAVFPSVPETGARRGVEANGGSGQRARSAGVVRRGADSAAHRE